MMLVLHLRLALIAQIHNCARSWLNLQWCSKCLFGCKMWQHLMILYFVVPWRNTSHFKMYIVCQLSWLLKSTPSWLTLSVSSCSPPLTSKVPILLRLEMSCLKRVGVSSCVKVCLARGLYLGQAYLNMVKLSCIVCYNVNMLMNFV